MIEKKWLAAVVAVMFAIGCVACGSEPAAVKGKTLKAGTIYNSIR